MHCLPALLLLLAHSISASQFASILGDGAASQLIRHAAKYALNQPRFIEVLLKTTDDPRLSSLARIELDNRISFKNLTILFHEGAFLITVENFSMLTKANVTNLLWPLGLNDHMVDMNVELLRGDVEVVLGEWWLTLGRCSLSSPSLSASASTHWLANAGAGLASLLLSPALDSALCALLQQHLSRLNHTGIMHFPVDALLPLKARRFLVRNETNIYYRLKQITVHDHLLTTLAQIEWNATIAEDDGGKLLRDSNISVMEMEVRGDDMATVWLEDGILNELLSQLEWNFEWMQEAIPMTSSVIPPDSRDFLSTLCTQCYFLLNVSAHGQPLIQATNSSFVLEKRDRVNLRVVNPDKNVTSVFVSFVLSLQAEMRPSFDNGILRTLVQLIDTHIDMESGAFPKNWALFMQDLMRGMIMDMLWPEIKNAIEELSYGKGVRISRFCGIDPSHMAIDIGEGNFALTTKLALQRLDIEKCIREIKSSIPNTSKIFNNPIA